MPAATMLKPFTALRQPLCKSFSTSIGRFNQPKSSCVAGTVLNLKIRKSGDEPVALEDSEYPAWLWDVLDKEKTDLQLKEENVMQWRKKQLSKKNSAKIKNNNFLAQM